MIEFKNVYKKYDSGTEALKNINLRIERGEFVFIVGASGSGKSTFLKTIMREEVPTSGTIMINNFDLTKMTDKEIPYFRRTMGIVFQDFRLIPNMTVYDNVAFAMRVIGANEKEIKKRVPYVLSLVGLQNKARSMPNQISGGEQQRVALARALVNNANTIIADEPTGNIDPEMSYEIVDLLNHINENGTTIIMVTHEHELVKKFNHRIVVIDHGSVISDTAAGSSLSYDETTGYKPLAETTTIIPAEISLPTEVVSQPVADTSVEEPVESQEDIELQNEIAAKVSASKVGSGVAGPNQSLYLEQLAAIEAATKAETAVEKSATTFATLKANEPAAEPAQSSTISQVFTIPIPEAMSTAEEPVAEESAADSSAAEAPKNSFTTIDGVDYSKYFEDSDEEA